MESLNNMYMFKKGKMMEKKFFQKSTETCYRIITKLILLVESHPH